MTDLYKAPPPTTGGYWSHTTRRSWLCLDDPDPGWGVPNTRVNNQNTFIKQAFYGNAQWQIPPKNIMH